MNQTACCSTHQFGLVGDCQSAIVTWVPFEAVDMDTMIPASPLNTTETHVEVVMTVTDFNGMN